MITDHITTFESAPDLKRGSITIYSIYTTKAEAIYDINTNEETINLIKTNLAKDIQKQMIKDLSGYFDDSFTEEDVFYITTINHKQLEDMRKLAELTKYMSTDEVEKILKAYEGLKNLNELGLFK